MTTTPLLYALPGSSHLAAPLRQAMQAACGEVDVHRFPDGESYVRFVSDPAGQHVILLSCLNEPDSKLIPLLLAARTAKDLRAASVGLVAPYMPYLRQDTAFQPGEAVSARHIGALLSETFSWAVTLDPHLHRLSALDEVFSIPAGVASAAGSVSGWVRNNVENPIICGPDSESEQWASAIAAACQAPYAVFRKTRHDAQSVDIHIPDGLDLAGYVPVIVDDIVSTGGTMISLVSQLHRRNGAAPVCCIVHGLFPEITGNRILHAGARQLVTTNSIRHKTNAIDISMPLATTSAETLDHYLSGDRNSR
ncbi:ribose-phosphate diphosphokinase [Henriciella sp.]|uniref:ribose-phosphate diphosphokinase n=1 Tax=Henriciella sp. TaxID=1968823 RepID=UPI00262BEC8B|nr:ribose-phosphate diphosphokinase [Henriciella sp.]